MPELEIEGITKRFGSETAVDDLSLSVEKGQFKSLLGPSGCGKTTTLRCVAGLERPDEGRIRIDGETVFDADRNIHIEPEDRGVGMVFQSYAVWPHMTVRENVVFPLEIQKVPKEERKEKVDDVLDTVGLGDHAEDLATNLSGGQQQRVAIARSIVVEPTILAFDEPLASLDAKLRREMRMEIKRICKDLDITILYVTHSQDEAMFLSDEIAIMEDGKVVEEGDPATLHDDPKTLFGMEFIGHTTALPCTVRSYNGSAGVTIETPIGELIATKLEDGLKEGDEGILTFRPKYCEIQPSEDAATNTIEGTITVKAPTRDFTEYEIDVDGHTITAKTPDPKSIETGDPVRLAIDPSAIKVWRSLKAEEEVRKLRQ